MRYATIKALTIDGTLYRLWEIIIPVRLGGGATRYLLPQTPIPFFGTVSNFRNWQSPLMVFKKELVSSFVGHK